MEFILEILFELILEGSIEFGGDKKVPLIVRIILMSIFGLIYAGLIGIIAMVGISAWERDSVATSIFIFVLDGLFVVLVGFVVRTKFVESKKRKRD